MMDILVALLVVGAIALVAGVLLALISHFFSVPADEKVKAVRACLPGVNCGACGYSSCRENAIAVVRNMAEPEMCIPYMRRLAQQRADRIIDQRVLIA